MYEGNSSLKTIAEKIENNGSYKWTIEENLLTKENYKIVISSTENEKVRAETNIFTIDAIAPSVQTAEVTNIRYNTAVCGGDVASNETYKIIDRGLCWSTSANPTVTNNKISSGAESGLLTSYMSGLEHNTTYYARAYATNIIGTGYGDVQTFATLHMGENTIIDYNGNVYETVIIGNQVWMAENLKSTHIDADSPIMNYEYSNDENNVHIYGRLYTWTSAMNNSIDVQGICPDGWHIPTDTELETLGYNLGGASNAGGKMKEEGTAHWNSPNTGADNSSGFNGLPAGYYNHYGGNYSNLHLGGYFWSSTAIDSQRAWSNSIYHDNPSLWSGGYNKEDALSIRCLKD